ncbi:MAG: aminopeptidase P family protein [Eubacterium sp.]|nr:aminopeptidase P family protein [Eubacterium sp.]
MNYNEIFEKKNGNVLLITDRYNLRYYTGFRGGEGTAVVTPTGRYLIVDSRYTEAAKEDVAIKGSGFTVIEFNNDEPKFKILAGILIEMTGNINILFEDKSLTVSEFKEISHGIAEAFKKYYPQFEEILRSSLMNWIPAGDNLEIPRRIKTPEEIQLLREAEAIGDKAFQDVIRLLKPGMTELEVAAEIEYSLKKHGAEGLSFDTIAASGINSSKPHAIPGRKKLENGDFLTMDFGCVYEGYCSDMTRTVVIGRADDEMKKVYNTVLKAQTEAVQAIKAGLVCMDVDKIARDIIAAEGYGQYFGHGLGHSVGLYIHESPALNTRDETILEEGMIETIEPGIYIPDKYGVRIEDMGAVTAEGYDNFASSAKELIEIM